MNATASAGERWTICARGQVHWGANGGARFLFRYSLADGMPLYLLVQRSRRVDEGGTWGIPGGTIRDAEPPETAARRETLEEIGRLPRYRIAAVEPQDCGGAWVFHVIIADVDESRSASGSTLHDQDDHHDAEHKGQG